MERRGTKRGDEGVQAGVYSSEGSLALIPLSYHLYFTRHTSGYNSFLGSNKESNSCKKNLSDE